MELPKDVQERINKLQKSDMCISFNHELVIGFSALSKLANYILEERFCEWTKSIWVTINYDTVVYYPGCEGNKIKSLTEIADYCPNCGRKVKAVK
ncbi:MAG TPA: hypothetical protein ENH82_03175 [bacterium]|nr:hypothetical protein [bacterium]